MTKGKLEIMLREAGTLPRDRDFFLFGSQSLRAILSNYPGDFPESLEADLYSKERRLIWSAGEDAENDDGDGSPEAPWGGLDAVWRIPTRIK